MWKSSVRFCFPFKPSKTWNLQRLRSIRGSHIPNTNWTDEARILSWEKHDGILLYLTQMSTLNHVLARFYSSHVISIRPWSYVFKTGIWLENTHGRDRNSSQTPCCSQSGSDLNAADFSMKLIKVDAATRLSNTFLTFMCVQANTKAIISAVFSVFCFKFDNSCLDFTAKVLPAILLHPSWRFMNLGSICLVSLYVLCVKSPPFSVLTRVIYHRR